MDIGAIGAQTQTQLSGTETEDGNKFGQDKFLQLLVAQMKNQDPVNPMDGKEFASQLAQFNSVEQLIGVNDSLSSLQDSQEMMRTEMTNSMAAALTGKHVRALSNQVSLESGGNADVSFELNNPADEVKLSVVNESGSIVRNETLNNVSAGENSWTWDGKNNDGVPLSGGSYSIEINASNGDEKVQTRMFAEGVADRIRFSGNGVLISIGSIEVPISNIETVGKGNN